MKPSFQHNLRQIYCRIWQQDTSSQPYAAWYSTTSHLISSLHFYLPHSLCKSFFIRKIINPTTSGCQLSFSLHLDQPLRENRITDAFLLYFSTEVFFFFFFFAVWLGEHGRAQRLFHMREDKQQDPSWSRPSRAGMFQEMSNHFLFHFKCIKASSKSGRAPS